jgi:hypothetical protein
VPGSELEPVTIDRDGLDLDRGRNVVQAVMAATAATVGAVIGYRLTDDEPWLAALAGAVAGICVGTFVSGLVLMFGRGVSVSQEVAKAKAASLRRRQIRVCIGYVATSLLLVPFIAWFGDFDAWGFVACLGWACLNVGLCAYGEALGWQRERLARRIAAAEGGSATIGSPRRIGQGAPDSR